MASLSKHFDYIPTLDVLMCDSEQSIPLLWQIPLTLQQKWIKKLEISRNTHCLNNTFPLKNFNKTRCNHKVGAVIRIRKSHEQKCHDCVILSHLHFDVSLVSRVIAIPYANNVVGKKCKSIGERLNLCGSFRGYLKGSFVDFVYVVALYIGTWYMYHRSCYDFIFRYAINNIS